MRKVDFDYIRSQGYTGASADMLIKYLADNGYNLGAITDDLYNMMISQGSEGALSDLLSTNTSILSTLEEANLLDGAVAMSVPGSVYTNNTYISDGTAGTSTTLTGIADFNTGDNYTLKFTLSGLNESTGRVRIYMGRFINVVGYYEDFTTNGTHELTITLLNQLGIYLRDLIGGNDLQMTNLKLIKNS